MKITRPFVVFIVFFAAVAGLVGFSAGRFLACGESEKTSIAETVGSPAPGRPDSPATSGTAPSPSATARKNFPLPPARFSSRADMDAYVARLQKSGFSEGLAKWLAVSASMRSEDLATSFKLARDANLEREWAVAAALTNPRGGFPLVHTLRGSLLFGSMDDSGAVSLFFQTLGRTDPTLGRQLLGQISSFDAAAVASALFRSMAETSPEAAMAAASAIKVKNVREQALTGLFRQWGERDRHAMMEWAVGQGPQMGKLAFRSQLDFSCMRDPEEVLALAQEFPSAVDDNTLTNVAGQLVAKGVDGWKPIAEFPEGKLRDGMISWFANRLSEAAPQAAWDLAKSLSPEDRAKFLDWTAIRTLAKVAPAEIAQIVRDGDYSDLSGIRDVVAVWAEKDPKAAFIWSAKNLTGSHRTDSLGATLDGWARSDPASAAAAVNGLTPGMRAKLLPDLLSAWGGSAPQAAFAYTQQLSAVERDRATESLFKGWAFSDPTAAGKALLAQPSTGMGGAYDQVAWRLAEKNPAAAMDWTAEISDPAMRDRVARKVAESWGGKDASAASERLSQLPPGSYRDSAVAGFVGSIRELDPSTAATWAYSISQPGAQKRNLQTVLQSWKKDDPNAARAFAAQLPTSKLKDDMVRLVSP